MVLLGVFALAGHCSAAQPDPVEPRPTAAADPAPAGLRERLARGLREARERAGLSVADAGIQAGLSRSRLTAIENGSRVPEGGEVYALRQVYRLDPAELNALMELQWRLEHGGG